jgi:hypothetical protein
MWSWFKSLDKANRTLVLVLASVGLLFVAAALTPEPASRSLATEFAAERPASSGYVDPRYREAAERRGYKGKEAEDIAVAAERLCRGTGGADC